MKINPVYDRLLVRRQSLREFLGIESSTLELPNNIARWDKVPQLADVLAVGPDVTLVKVGDRICVGRFAGTDVDLSEGTCILIRESEILGIVSE